MLSQKTQAVQVQLQVHQAARAAVQVQLQAHQAARAVVQVQ